MVDLLKTRLVILTVGFFASMANAQMSKEDITKGQQLITAGDCISCHTAQSGEPYAGGLKMFTPIGAIYSTNITPDKATGIGDYSYEEFVKAVREGVAKDGRELYPAMPYTSFAKVTDQDIRFIYDYLMTQVPTVSRENHKTDIPWLLSMRWPLAVWNDIYLDKSVYQPDNSKSSEWNRGAYLVQGLAHCGACHTPRGVGFAEKALDQTENSYLSGAELDNWYAPSLASLGIDGLETWSEKDIAEFLKTGHSDKNAAFGSMTDVIKNSTQYLPEQDLMAIAVYLKSLKPAVNSEPKEQDASATITALTSGDMSQPGAQEYMDNCSACHRIDGKGYAKTFPTLAGSSIVLSENPESMIRIVLNGSQMPVTKEAPTGLSMPDFAWRLDDFQIANLMTFVRSSWGNNAPKVTVSEVKSVRDTTVIKQDN